MAKLCNDLFVSKNWDSNTTSKSALLYDIVENAQSISVRIMINEH